MSSALSLAESLLQSGNVAGAFKILMDFPDKGVRRNFLLGQCAARMGNAAVAIPALATALAADPRHVPSATLLGDIYLRLGMVDKAEALYRDFLARHEDDGLRVAQARLLALRQRVDASIVEFGRVLARNPRHAFARQCRGDLLAQQRRFAEAAADYRELTVQHPGEAAPWANLGIVEGWLGRHAEAERHLRRALELQPGNGKCLFELAWVLITTGQVEPAREVLAQLKAADPARLAELQQVLEKQQSWGVDGAVDPRPLFIAYTYARLDECNWTYREAYDRVVADFARAPLANPAGGAHCAGIVPLTLAEKRHLLEQAAAFTADGIVPWTHVPAPAPARLRVGYLLPHLGEHVVARIMERVWAAHSDAVEVIVIASAMNRDDVASPLLARVQALPGVRCVDVTQQDDAAAAATVRDLGLDVLVDLGIYNDQARPGIAARRPAPVQVNWLGAPYTSGAPWMDYIVTDPVVSPGVPGWCSEAEVRLPSCYFVFGHHVATPPPLPARREVGLPEGVFIYSGLCNGYKIDPEIFARWMRILKATPGSVLLLKEGAERQANLLREAAAHGVGPERLVFPPKLLQALYIARMGLPDLFLDTPRYNGHTTMAESLWMGAPAISWPGADFQTRVGASLLESCGLPELVVADGEAYEALAIALFHDRERLAALRARLLANRATAAPFDIAGQARALEKAWWHMRRRFADGLPPAPFDVAALPD